MAVRNERAAGLRRLARSRAGYVALALTLYAAAAAWAAWPAVLHAGSDFLAGGAPGHGEAAPGDHLQTGWHLWLVGDQLQHLRAPWRDPYTFRPETGGEANFAGWPFGLVYWPLAAALGTVLAWNVFTLLVIAAAGGLACWWLRELGLPRGAALAGGLAFSLAPYRVEQSVGHLLGPISIMLPLALLGIEKETRRWAVVAAAALASIPLSGQVHLALGAIPFVSVYALVRRRWAIAVAGALAAAAAGVLVQETSIKGSVNAGGRSLAEVQLYQARLSDFWTRHEAHGSESFVYVGWATPFLALAGLVVLWRGRRGLALVFGLGALVPMLLALGTNLPVYTQLWHALPPFRYPRVPERLMPIAVLCLAALVGVAVGRARRVALVSTLAIALLLVDLHVRLYGHSAADPANAAYAAAPGGRLLELPIFLPDVHYGSVYFYYDLQARLQRPGGYSTTAPAVTDHLARQLERLNCGDWSSVDLGALGIRSIAVHRGLYEHNSAVPDRWWFATLGLVRHGWKPVAVDGRISMWARGRSGPVASGEPPRGTLHFCQGWYGPENGQVPMSEPHAPLWVYGSGTIALAVQSPQTLVTRFSVDGRLVATRTVSNAQRVVLPLGSAGWHLIALDVPRLLDTTPRKTGVRIVLG
jgi:hypothetical protein